MNATNGNTLVEVFKSVINQDTQKFAENLGQLNSGQYFSYADVDSDDKPIKGGTYEKHDTQYYGYFAKNIFDVNKELSLEDCFTIDELCDLANNSSLKTKASANQKPQVIGPLSFSEVINLKKALDYINMSQALKMKGDGYFQKISGAQNPKP